ncbi:hypothetical protein Acr_00g0042260 [Actinidia rufa]|uniref:Uncharacterized protein n=1 Tax=Actinidia rufa TaxID=165716 RepID=A0A7J0DIC8_9ERIC|nr:hypothetical protein Acr_00g0042260 [Actinidia rufa]
MSENTSEVSSSRHTTISSVPNHSTLISFNAAEQLPVKLTHENYTSWKAQWDALLYGYDLLGFISRTKPCPPETILENDNYVTNPDFILWMQHDKLLFHGIISSLSERVLPRAILPNHILRLGITLPKLVDYLGTIQAIADDLATIDQLVSNAHLVNHVLNGIRAEYKEIFAAVRARDSIISFEELHDKLIEYESYLKREESRNNASITANAARSSQPKYGYQGKKHNPSYSNNQSFGPGQRQTALWTNNNNSANSNKANLTTTTSGGTHNSNWLLDSGASHHVTSDFSNLSPHQPYDGPDDIVIGDGTAITLSLLFIQLSLSLFPYLLNLSPHLFDTTLAAPSMTDLATSATNIPSALSSSENAPSSGSISPAPPDAPSNTHPMDLLARFNLAGMKETSTPSSTSTKLLLRDGSPSTNATQFCSLIGEKQRTVARSSTEAEYRSVASAAAELTWIQNLLTELGISLPVAPHLLCDNIGTTYLCANPVFHSRMKHLALDYHFVREKVQTGSLQDAHVSTQHQLAAILTKPLSKPRFTLLQSKIGISDGSTILQGHNRKVSQTSVGAINP